MIHQFNYGDYTDFLSKIDFIMTNDYLISNKEDLEEVIQIFNKEEIKKRMIFIYLLEK